MKKLWMSLIACSFLLVACGKEEEINSNLEQHEGLIAEIVEGDSERAQILVISNIAEQDIANKNSEALRQLARENDGASYSFEVTKFEGLEVGAQIIAYWNGTQLESDPPQRTLEKVEILSE